MFRKLHLFWHIGYLSFDICFCCRSMRTWQHCWARSNTSSSTRRTCTTAPSACMSPWCCAASAVSVRCMVPHPRWCSVLQGFAACLKVLLCVARVLRRLHCLRVLYGAAPLVVAVCCSVLQGFAVCFKVLQCVAMVLRRLRRFCNLNGDAPQVVAMCCRVLQRVARCSHDAALFALYAVGRCRVL